jgi:stearoyl-CoA desaturase (delta-9 desaturase)
MRLFFVHHSTFCVNSVAHYFGEHTFDDDRTPRDSIVTALLTFGEGYHNFHHEFPNDYRNGIRWYHYDPTKWLIVALNRIGCAFRLREFPDNEIKRGVIYMKERKLAQLKQQVKYPPHPNSLPMMKWSEFQSRVKKEGEALIVIDTLVHDLKEFLPHHPGSEALLRAYLGTDASLTFFGKTQPVLYKHSHAAHNMLSNMRVARMDMSTVPVKETGKKQA